MKTLRETIGSKTAVIFDLFHTLTALEITSGGRGLRSYDLLGVSRADWDAQLVAHSRNRWVGKPADAAGVVRAMAHAINPAIPEEKIREVVVRRDACFRAALREMPAESCEVLARLKARGRKVALLSNADVLEAAGWRECPAVDLFDVAIFSCHVGWAKPGPEIYHHCLQQLGVGPEEAVFVGDGGSDELAGARRVGLTTVLITGIIKDLWPERIPQRRESADFVIERLTELA